MPIIAMLLTISSMSASMKFWIISSKASVRLSIKRVGDVAGRVGQDVHAHLHQHVADVPGLAAEEVEALGQQAHHGVEAVGERLAALLQAVVEGLVGALDRGGERVAHVFGGLVEASAPWRSRASSAIWRRLSTWSSRSSKVSLAWSPRSLTASSVSLTPSLTIW